MNFHVYYIVNTFGVQIEDMVLQYVTIKVMFACEVCHTVITLEFEIQELVCATFEVFLYVIYSKHMSILH